MSEKSPARKKALPEPEPPAKQKVLIVEDHPVFLHGLVALIEAQADFEVCGKACDAPAALTAMRTHSPVAAIVDIMLPGTNGVELVKMMKAEQPGIAILIVSMHDESQYALRSLRAGALGYIMKGEAEAQIVEGLRRILLGEIFLSKDFSERLIFKTIGTSEPGNEASPISKLTQRETEVLELMGRGFGTKDIGEQLNMSGKTVETHRGHIREKLKLRGTGELVRFAMDWVLRMDLK